MKKIHVFSTSEERARGLQLFPDMEKEEIALFIEPEPRYVTFNNKNVNFDIKISFYNKNGELLKVDRLPEYTKGLSQTSCDNAKYIMEKRAWTAKVIPRSLKGLRNILAGSSKFIRRGFDYVPHIPIQGNTMESVGARYTANATRNFARTLLGGVGARPDEAAFYVAANTVFPAISPGTIGMPLTEIYLAAKKPKKAWNATKAVATAVTTAVARSAKKTSRDSQQKAVKVFNKLKNLELQAVPIISNYLPR